MALTPAEIEALVTDLPALLSLYAKVKAAVSALPAGDTKAVDYANVAVQILPDLGTLIDNIRAQVKG